MTTPQQVQLDLEKAEIYIQYRNWYSDRAVFHLYCGLSVTVYYMADAVHVKGTPKVYYRWSPVAALRAVLPVKTLWQKSLK
ncbi:MAG: hypothetical protein PSV24_07070 [Rhodoferax sp.]|nr:hypothetical protein [Rhodoferax sp.]